MPPSSGALDRALRSVARYHVATVLAVAFLVRSQIFFALDTVTTGWHSADYGSIARNYFQNGFRFWYPQIDWGGDGPGYVEMEFPLVPFLTALLYGLAGRADDRLAVVVPLVSGLLAVWFAYRLAQRLFAPSVALLAGILVGVSPVLARFSQLAFPEAPMVAASTGAVYASVLWLDSGRARHLIATGLATSLALLLKPTALVLGAPLLWVFWLRYGSSLWRRPELYALGFMAIVPSVVWYGHALTLTQQYGNSFGIILGGGSNKFAELALLADPSFYRRLVERITIYHLTLGGALGLLAAVRVTFSREQRLVPIWFAAAGLMLFIAAGGNYDVAYYQLPIVVPGCLAAAAGLLWLDAALSARAPRLASLHAAGIGLLLGAGVVAGSVLHYTRSDYVPFTLPLKQQSVALGAVLEPGTLIVYSERQSTRRPMPRGQHVTPPVPFYFSGHRGWYLATDWATVDEVERLRHRGGRYFVAADVGELRRERPAVVEHLDTTYRRMKIQVGFTVWDLQHPVAGHGPS